MGRGDAGAEQRQRDRRAAVQRPPRPRGAHGVRGGRDRGRQARHRAAPGPRPLRRVRRARPGGARPDRVAAAGQDARGVPSRGSRPGRRDPCPACRDQRADHGDRPGVQPQHPRRRTHREGDARAARRPAGGLAGRTPGRRRRAGHGDDRLPRRGAGPDVRAGPGGPPPDHRGVPRARLARQRAAAQGALRPAPRVRQPGRLLRLGVVRRRGEDDREGAGDPGVHRPHRTSRPRSDGARPGRGDGALPAGRARRRLDHVGRRRLLRGGRAQGAARRRLTAGAHLLRVRQGQARVARRHRPAVRPALRAGPGRGGLARGRHRVRRLLDRRRRRTARASAGSTSTCTRGRGSSSTPRSSRSPTAWPGGSCRRVRCCATSTRG